MSDQSGLVTTYCGRPIEDLEKDELLEALREAVQELEAIRNERERMARHMNWLSYLKDKK